MISFATVEKIEGNTIKLYLEMYPEMCGRYIHRKWRKKHVVYDDFSYVKRFIPDISEGDVLAVEHSGNCIISYIEKDEEEKQRRIQHLKTIFQSFRR